MKSTFNRGRLPSRTLSGFPFPRPRRPASWLDDQRERPTPLHLRFGGLSAIIPDYARLQLVAIALPHLILKRLDDAP